LFHDDIVGRLETELANIKPQTIYMGWHTDPYQPCKAECRHTRKVLALLLEKGFSASILTKSDLVLRDMDLLASMENASVSVSVSFNDNDVRRLFEANTMEYINKAERVLSTECPEGILEDTLKWDIGGQEYIVRR